MCPPPLCPENEHWNKCAFECGPQCIYPPAQCGFGPMVCNAGCQCNKGFKRGVDDICHPEANCPTDFCPENEEWKMCARCEPTCEEPMPQCSKECQKPRCQCLVGLVRNADGKCVKPEECSPGTLESDCDPGFQRHSDGECYAFLSAGKSCDMTVLPFNDVVGHKKCRDSLAQKKKCKLQCLFDKKNRSKKLSKAAFIQCVPAVNKEGKTIGSQFKYFVDYKVYSNMCGTGCNLLKLQDFMGSTVESSNCIPDENGNFSLADLADQ